VISETQDEGKGANMDSALLEQVSREEARQVFWRRFMSFAYFGAVALSILSSGGATVLAGAGHSELAAAFAGLATVLLGLEKGLLLREKWIHHLMVSTRLTDLAVRHRHGGLSDHDAAEAFTSTLTEYALNLPIPDRDAAAH